MFIVITRRSSIFLIILIAAAVLAVSGCILQTIQADTINDNSKAASRYLIFIDIEEKKLYLFDNDQLVKTYMIASGTSNTPSPIGQWKITYKSPWGSSFGGRWMGLNVPWGKYGIHGTNKENSIGYAASHGCIRMYNKDIKELYKIVPAGTRVVIRNGPLGPFGTGFRILNPGDRGSDVLAVQQRLKKLGYYSGRENGIYEDNLKSALTKFQKDNNLKIKHSITYQDYLAMGFKIFE